MRAQVRLQLHLRRATQSRSRWRLLVPRRCPRPRRVRSAAQTPPAASSPRRRLPAYRLAKPVARPDRARRRGAPRLLRSPAPVETRTWALKRETVGSGAYRARSRARSKRRSERLPLRLLRPAAVANRFEPRLRRRESGTRLRASVSVLSARPRRDSSPEAARWDRFSPRSGLGRSECSKD